MRILDKIMRINNKIKRVLLIIIGILAGLILFFIGKADLVNDVEKIVLNIDSRNYVLYTARTALEKVRGLSEITELKNADGMVFFFNSGSKPTFGIKTLIWIWNLFGWTAIKSLAEIFTKRGQGGFNNKNCAHGN